MPAGRRQAISQTRHHLAKAWLVCGKAPHRAGLSSDMMETARRKDLACVWLLGPQFDHPESLCKARYVHGGFPFIGGSGRLICVTRAKGARAVCCKKEHSKDRISTIILHSGQEAGRTCAPDSVHYHEAAENSLARGRLYPGLQRSQPAECTHGNGSILATAFAATLAAHLYMLPHLRVRGRDQGHLTTHFVSCSAVNGRRSRCHVGPVPEPAEVRAPAPAGRLDGAD